MQLDITKYADLIRFASSAEITFDLSLGGKLTIACDGALAVQYAPFDHVQKNARVVIVGITPGSQQASNALIEMRRLLLSGADSERALEGAKIFASFSGPMRSNLVSMLDFIEMNKWLGIKSTAELWNGRADLVHFTSALRYPVYVNGKNYSGQPRITRTALLTQMLTNFLADEIGQLNNAVWIPLGPTVTEAMDWMVARGALPRERVLVGLPHPSGANAERIAYFMRRKDREELSSKTNAETIDRVRAQLVSQVARL